MGFRFGGCSDAFPSQEIATTIREYYPTHSDGQYQVAVSALRDTVSLAELKQISSFDHGSFRNLSRLDIYNSGTQQIVIFQPIYFIWK